jgi:hypothetical protein
VNVNLFRRSRGKWREGPRNPQEKEMVQIQKRQKSTKAEATFPSTGRTTESKASPTEALITSLGSHDDVVRVKARHTLVSLGKAAVPSLIVALKNKNDLVRWEATKALGEIGDPESAPALVRGLEDEDFDVRWLAAEGDVTTAFIFKEILEDEEDHHDLFTTMLEEV